MFERVRFWALASFASFSPSSTGRYTLSGFFSFVRDAPVVFGRELDVFRGMSDEVGDELSEGFLAAARGFLEPGKKSARQPNGEDSFVCSALICHRGRCSTLAVFSRQRFIFKKECPVCSAQFASQFTC